jgi:hypothetical protein
MIGDWTAAESEAVDEVDTQSEKWVGDEARGRGADGRREALLYWLILELMMLLWRGELLVCGEARCNSIHIHHTGAAHR